MGLYSRALIIEGIFASEIWGGLFSGGLIYLFIFGGAGGGAYYLNFTVYYDLTCDSTQNIT